MSMKRLFTLFALLVAHLCGALAAEVSPDIALRIAAMVLGDATRSGDVAIAWDSSRIVATRGEVDAPTFYVVTPASGRGFVIVAGDDAVVPVLVYSDKYAAPSADVLPKNFEAWLHYIDSAVRYAREHNIESKSAFAELLGEEYKPVSAVMLNTARWSQVPPYNNHCPIDGNTHSLTGCTQTAMAIIMYHNRWPECAQGVTEPYTTKGCINVPSRDLNHAYDWDNMIETYVEGGYNDVQAEAVAVLMADLGHAFKAEYTAVDTGAMPDMMALYKNFGYSPASNIVVRNNFNSDSWVSKLRRDIESGHPVFYAGYTSEGAGHAFVLDGVDANDYFHVNWGWGGVYDGFFMIDNLTLGEEYLFDTQHWAVFGMAPLCGGEVDNWLTLTNKGLCVSTTEFERGKLFNVEPIPMGNYSQLDFRGEVRVGVCGADGELKSWATEAQKFDLPSFYATSCDGMSAVVNDDIMEGDRLCAFYRSNGSDTWFKMQPHVDNACSEVVMKYAPIGETTSLSFDKDSGLLIVAYDDDVKSALYMLGEYVETGVYITKGRMALDTKQFQRGVTYTIYLERKDLEQKSIMFTLNGL